MIIGLTGGIACGKSTVAKMLSDLGSIIVDADKIAREVVEPGQAGLLQIVERFGEGVLFADGTLNRKALGAIVFSDLSARQDLNQILHPLIRQVMKERKEQALALNPPLVVLDIPLLFESKLQQMVEKVVVVYIPRKLQLQRLMERDQISMQEAEQRIASQMDIEKKKELADFVIDNSGSIEETKRLVEDIFTKLSKGI
ncbi:dephospho-CoA kinase [Ammoniphilus resinae]|uniref:Dephospho-CoA kinase n=1 Tax=Ammoniphilus resinae TaxID=861532 RepID=A0ABS4GJ72_9BACL|nr:dephospho-CoA kinase [Ammoniphilus resinae]MBP1930313.1 dephospho-CoA kinase [Ammoniphilus resinae]